MEVSVDILKEEAAWVHVTEVILHHIPDTYRQLIQKKLIHKPQDRVQL